MKYINKPFIIFISIVLLNACSMIKTKPVVPKIVFVNGYNDEYISKRNIIKRKTCTDKNNNIQAHIAEDELIKLAEIAIEIGFFDLPKVFATESDTTIDGLSVMVVSSPCAEYKLSISYDDLDHSVYWQCNHGSEPKELTPLLKAIKHKLYNLTTVMNAPESQCIYY